MNKFCIFGNLFYTDVRKCVRSGYWVGSIVSWWWRGMYSFKCKKIYTRVWSMYLEMWGKCNTLFTLLVWHAIILFSLRNYSKISKFNDSFCILASLVWGNAGCEFKKILCILTCPSCMLKFNQHFKKNVNIQLTELCGTIAG